MAIDVGKACLLGVGQVKQSEDRVALIPLPGISDQGGDAVFEGGRPRGKEAAEAPSDEDHLVGIDLRTGLGHS